MNKQNKNQASYFDYVCRLHLFIFTLQEQLLDMIIGMHRCGPSSTAVNIFSALERDPDLVRLAEERKNQVVLNTGADDVGFSVFVQVILP